LILVNVFRMILRKSSSLWELNCTFGLYNKDCGSLHSDRKGILRFDLNEFCSQNFEYYGASNTESDSDRITTFGGKVMWPPLQGYMIRSWGQYAASTLRKPFTHSFSVIYEKEWNLHRHCCENFKTRNSEPISTFAQNTHVLCYKFELFNMFFCRNFEQIFILVQ